MIIAIDIEQRIDCALQKNNFFFGTIYGKKGKICKTIYNKKEFWEELKKIAIKEAKQKRNTYIYAHNHYFDFLQYADLNDSNIIYRSTNPLIFERNLSNKEKKENKIDQNNKNKMFFLDSWALYNGSLESLGKIIKLEKKEFDFEKIKEIKEIENKIDQNIKDDQVNNYINYNIQDTKIVYEFLNFLKMNLKKIKFRPKRLMTITLLSRNYYLSQIKKLEEKGFFGELEKTEKNGKTYYKSYIFKDRLKNIFYKPSELIMEKQTIAGRGGRFEVFQLGNFKNCSKIDINSAYTEAMNNIRFPNLKSMNGLIYDPDNYFNTKKREYLNKIGISLVHLQKNEKSEVGIVPIRYEFDNQVHQIFPNNKNLNLIGSYTHQEINYFLKNGFELKKVLYTIYYEKEIKNPLPEINKKLYKLRKKNEFWNHFAKAIMNYFSGSLKQNREYLEKKYDYRLYVDEYIKKGYSVNTGHAGKFLYIKGKNKKIYSKSFAGQIYADITANIRIKITELLKQIGNENIIYVPCDSVIFKDKKFQEIKNEIKINDNIGSFKLEHENKNGYIISKQQYYIDKDIKIAGVLKKDIEKNKDIIKKIGTIKTKKMVSLFRDFENAGSFTSEIRDFKESEEKTRKLLEEIKNINFFIDNKDLKLNKEIITKYLKKIDKYEEKNECS